MKKAFTLIVCCLLFQIVKAGSFSTPLNFSSPHYFSRDTTVLPAVNQPAALTLHEGIFERRLDSIKKDVPLDYNEYVQGYIDTYLHNRDEMARVIGLSKYYFPIYEKAFRDAGIPDEIKYLSIVESKLDPTAVSRVGAAGPWQFMFTTGKLYGLTIDDYVDDRRDPIQASYAAAAYLKDAYQEFGDWLLAIASYNCGKSTVEHAIEEANATDFWSIRQYLPVETRNYVPAFIAVDYVMNYYYKHGIIPQACDLSLKTDTVLVNKFVALSTVSSALGLDTRQLALLNPAYKRQIVNGTLKAPRRLIIPQVDKAKYSALYNALNNTKEIAAVPQPAYAAYYDSKPEKLPSYHTVRHGESLKDIADAYGVELSDLKLWNHLHGNKAVVGQRLKLSETTGESKAKPSVKHRQNYITYKVKTGDTLSGIAAKFDGMSIEKIKLLNGLKKDRLQPGMTIRIDRG
jgi:membrane-bound lytic murein transglycosylase D